MWLSLASFVGTLGAYIAARAIAKKASHVLVNSFVLGALLIIMGLYLTGIPYEQYRTGTQPIAFLLGPATVALAVPLWHNLPLLRRNLRPILIGGIAGALVGSGTSAAAQESHLGAAVAGIGMTVAAVATALVAPVIAHFLP